MKTLKRGFRTVSAVLFATVLLFGATQAVASTGSASFEYCPGTCPPYEGGFEGSCWWLCYDPPNYYGGDCDPAGDCCCFEKK